MQLSSLGIVANDCWKAISLHFPFVKTSVHIVMPNHIHGIITIDKHYAKSTSRVETQDFASLQHEGNKFGPQSKNLGSVIRGYKTRVTKYATQNNITFKWQPRFHDHLIRNEDAYLKIYNYIITNPQKWKEDKFYLE